MTYPYALTGSETLVIAAITLILFEFKLPARIHISLHGTVSDVLANVVLFIPLGFLFQLARYAFTVWLFHPRHLTGLPGAFGTLFHC
jgi:glycopeptide antibiotics resistance protein